MWWMDLKPYPGPAFQLSFTEAVQEVGKAVQVVLHTTEEFGKSVNQFFVGIEHLSTGPTHVWQPIRFPAPNLNKNGPRRGPVFDHRGRRRW